MNLFFKFFFLIFIFFEIFQSSKKCLRIRLFVKDLVAIVEHKVQEKYPCVRLEKDIQVPKDYVIFADKHRIMQIVLNFLTNAIKFTDEGHICIRVYVIDNGLEEYGLSNNGIRILVEDSGRGISEEQKRQMFKPFSQTQYSDSTRHGGVGLGLHLCKLLATAMNIKIDFSSTLLKGSSFWIDINGETAIKN